jgi:glutathione S-transferase
MSAPVTVYGPAISPAVARVAACLLEKDVPFQLQPVDMSKGEHKSPSFLKLQPFGQVPAFKDHLTTVFGRYPLSPSASRLLVPFNSKD